MAVEQLAIVGGPLAGLAGLAENGNGKNAIVDIATRSALWLRQHDVDPWWVTGGAVVGALLGERAFHGAAKGALMMAAASWLCTKSCQRKMQNYGVI
jgi:hypothetical protein